MDRETIHLSTSGTWDPHDWENLAQRLLYLRHGHQNYVPMPDGHGGDLGLEGYSTDGDAYQCYATEALGEKERYDGQRDKVTADIKKFIDNKDELKKLFHNIKIRRWVLLVPEHTSSKLVLHCAEKTKSVLAEGLPYVAPDFQMKVEDLSAFQTELKLVRTTQSVAIGSIQSVVKDDEVQGWIASNDVLVKRLAEKLNRVATMYTEDELNELRNEFISHYIAGQNALDRLEEEYPEFWEQVEKCKDERARFLRMECLTSPELPLRLLEIQRECLRSTLKDRVGAINNHTIDLIMYGTIAEWLIVCPISFRKLAA